TRLPRFGLANTVSKTAILDIAASIRITNILATRNGGQPLGLLAIDEPAASEVEAVDVRLVEDERRAQHDLVALHLDAAEAARGQLAVAGPEPSRGRGARGVHGEVAEVDRVPQHDALGNAGVDVRLAHVGQREAA